MVRKLTFIEETRVTHTFLKWDGVVDQVLSWVCADSELLEKICGEIY